MTHLHMRPSEPKPFNQPVSIDSCPTSQNTSPFSFILLLQIFDITSYSTANSAFLFYIFINFFIPKPSWDFMFLCYCLTWYLRPLLTNEGYVLFMNSTSSHTQTMSSVQFCFVVEYNCNFSAGQRDKSQSSQYFQCVVTERVEMWCDVCVLVCVCVCPHWLVRLLLGI